MTGGTLVVLILLWSICGCTTYAVADRKGIAHSGRFGLCFFGPAGIALALLMNSERPVPAPPASQLSGWYPDPWQQPPLRWYDGAQWTGYLGPTAQPPGRQGPAVRRNDLAERAARLLGYSGTEHEPRPAADGVGPEAVAPTSRAPLDADAPRWLRRRWP
jgi:Protein of unknown function (DUF2510)